jgi:hypothetical protein
MKQVNREEIRLVKLKINKLTKAQHVYITEGVRIMMGKLERFHVTAANEYLKERMEADESCISSLMDVLTATIFVDNMIELQHRERVFADVLKCLEFEGITQVEEDPCKK